MSAHIEIDIQEVRWPQMRLIINSPKGVRTKDAQYDIAYIEFEVEVQNVLKQAVQSIIQRRLNK